MTGARLDHYPRMVITGALAFVFAFAACAAIYGSRRRLAMALDPSHAGPQKFHAEPVPRIGGVPIFAAIGAAVLLSAPAHSRLWLMALLCAAVPAFIGGLMEDLTKRVSPAQRLLASFVAAALGFVLLDARVGDLDLPGSGLLLQVAVPSFLLTVFAVGGFSHALNIVDGFNGLSGMVTLLMLGALGVVAARVGDQHVLWAAVFIAGAVLGFLAWNFPRGLIFAGDGGAYLLGFLIAELAILLVHRNPEVSAWFPAVLLLYPIVETAFSIYRKKFLRGQSPAEPDGVHLHMLIHKRLVRRCSERNARWKMNSQTSPYLVAMAALAIVPGALFWDDTRQLQLVAAGFTLFYVWIYWRIVRFRVPRFLVLRRAARSGV